MGWLKQVLGLEAPKCAGKNAGVSYEPELPLCVALGSKVCITPDLKGVLAGESDIIVPDDDTILAIGTLDIGQGSRLIRCYFDNDDYFIQFVMRGPRADDIEDLQLFGYYDVKTLTSQAQLLSLIGPGSKIGMPYYALEGAEYGRQWGNEDGQAELIALTEKVVSAEGSCSVHHDCILYARHLGLAHRREFLFLSAETDEPGNLSLSTAVGVTLELSDISIL